MMRVSSNQVELLHDQTIERLTRSTVPWLRADHAALVNEISDDELNERVEKLIRFALDTKIAQEGHVRSIVVFHLREDTNPTDGTASSLLLDGFSESERVAAYINGSKKQRKAITLDSVLPSKGGAR